MGGGGEMLSSELEFFKSPIPKTATIIPWQFTGEYKV